MFKKLVLVSLSLLIFSPIFTLAADSPAPTQGLTVSPPLNEFTIKPGSFEKSSIKLSNPTQSVLEVYPSVVDFTSKDDTGDPYFLSNEETSRTYSLSAWFKYSPVKIAIAPEQIVDFEYEIAVPSDGGPGGHYGAIMFSNKPPLEDGKANQVGISSMVASLALVNVPGDVKEDAFISEFSTNKLYCSGLPADITTKVTNSGNTHMIPTGKIVIKSMFGAKVAEYQLNEAKGRILPEGTRKFTTKWENSGVPFWKSPFGRYTVELSAVYGSSSKYALKDSIAFWIVPLWIIITLIALLLIAAIITTIVIVRRRRNR
jgi:hypothetical protein